MPLNELYQVMTDEARLRFREEIIALCKERGIQCSREYLLQVMQGVRQRPCSRALAILISGYFCGMVGLSVLPDDVLASFRKPE